MEKDEIEQFKLTIITINKNNAEGLRKTIESVIYQTSKNFEYIVIDGFSTDNSINVIKEFKDRIDYWYSEPDSGIYNAMNKGLRKSNGEYCLFLNSGDYLIEDNSVEHIINSNPNSDIFSFGCKILRKRSSTIQLPPQEITLFTFICGSLPHPSTLIKRRLLNETNGYDENYRILSDWKFFYESLILRNVSYAYSEYVLTVFDGIAGLSTDYSDTETEELMKIIRNTIPRQIYLDYFLENRIEYEYFYNILQYQIMHRRFKGSVLLFIRLLNRLLKARNHNLRLNQIYFVRNRPKG